MIVTADSKKHEVTIIGDLGSEITMTWAQALNLGSLLIKKSEEAEPPAPKGKCYCPATERSR